VGKTGRLSKTFRNYHASSLLKWQKERRGIYEVKTRKLDNDKGNAGLNDGYYSISNLLRMASCLSSLINPSSISRFPIPSSLKVSTANI